MRAKFKTNDLVRITSGEYAGMMCQVVRELGRPEGREPMYELCDQYGHHLCAAESTLTILPPKGEHKDAGKDRLDLLPREGLRAASRALAYGISTGKYEPHNYVKGLLWMALVGSILRHVFRWVWDGRPDEESGLSDLDHAAADVLMLAEIVARHPELDDRPCKKFPPVDE